MSYNDSIITAKQFSAVDMKAGKTIWFSRSRSPQHLYPLTEKIMEGKENELENLMHGKSAKFIMENCPQNCTECCSFRYNNFMESLWHVLKLHENLEDVKFITHY